MNDSREILRSFALLLEEQRQKAMEEVNMNKAYHLGDKTFEYESTLTGHQPTERPCYEKKNQTHRVS